MWWTCLLFSRLYKIKELFKKTILNSSLNSHVYWETLYHIIYLKLFLSHHCSQCKCKLHNFKTYVYLNHSSSHLQTNKHTKLKTVYMLVQNLNSKLNMWTSLILPNPDFVTIQT